MADSDLRLVFGVDASGVKQGVDQAKSAVAGLAPQIDALAKSFSGLASQQRRAAESWKQANAEILGAENTLVANILKGRLKLGEQLERLAIQTATKEISADLRYFTERALLQAEGLDVMKAKEEGGLLVHLLAEQKKTAATAAGASDRAAAENAGFFAQMIAKLASLLGVHIGAEAAKTRVTVSAASARAGASAVASFAEAPWPIDLGAPAFGSAMAGAAEAFGSLMSAAGGFDVPSGVNPLTQLHAQEMVLPARLANPMRDMLASFGGGGGPSAVGHSVSFGDTHIHGAPNMSPADFKQALAEHRASVAAAVASALHGGWRPGYRQPVGAL